MAILTEREKSSCGRWQETVRATAKNLSERSMSELLAFSGGTTPCFALENRNPQETAHALLDLTPLRRACLAGLLLGALPMAHAEGVLLVGNKDGASVSALDMINGKELFKLPVGTGPMKSLSLATAPGGGGQLRRPGAPTIA